MQRLLFSILLSFFVFASCGRSTPKGILPEKKMVELLKEVHLTDAYLNTLSVDSARKVIDSYYQHIFTQYGLDSTSFADNMSYYLGHPNVGEKLYEKVIADLKKEGRSFEVRDSIQNAVMQDSIRKVQKELDEMRYLQDLISRVYIDSTKLTYEYFSNMFYSKIPFRMNVYGRDIPLQTISSPSAVNEMTKPVIPPVDSAIMKPIKIDSTADRLIKPVLEGTPIPLRTKPVVR